MDNSLGYICEIAIEKDDSIYEEIIYLYVIYALLIAQLVKNLPVMQETPVQLLGWEDPWRRDRLPTLIFLGFLCGPAGKESSCNAGDLGSFPWLGRSPGEGKGYACPYSGLENSVDSMSMGSQRVGHD